MKVGKIKPDNVDESLIEKQYEVPLAQFNEFLNGNIGAQSAPPNIKSF